MLNPAVLVVGSVTIDQIGNAARLGGLVTYAGATFARLGCRVAASYRAPGTSETVAVRLRSLRIDPLQQPSAHLTRFVHETSRHGERVLRVTHSAGPISPVAVPREWLRDAHLHLGPLYPDDLDPAWFELPVSNIVSIDLQGLVRSIDQSGLVLTEVSPLARSALRMATFVKTSEEELHAVLDNMQCDAPALIDRHGVRELVVTQGAKGGYVLTAGGDHIAYTAERAEGRIDTTGAGDVFFAAWLFERLYRHTEIAEACHRAALVAARQVSGQWLRPDELELERTAADG